MIAATPIAAPIRDSNEMAASQDSMAVTPSDVPRGVSLSPRAAFAGAGALRSRRRPCVAHSLLHAFHGAKALALRCSTGVSSGKCRSSTVVMLLFSIQSIPGLV